MQLSSRFASATPLLRADHPLSDEQIYQVAPSIYAEAKHQSRSERYTYIPTGEVLGALRKEGFQPFMVCQTRVRDTGKREHTKHMLRLRHANQINGAEANEIPARHGGELRYRQRHHGRCAGRGRMAGVAFQAVSSLSAAVCSRHCA